MPASMVRIHRSGPSFRRQRLFQYTGIYYLMFAVFASFFQETYGECHKFGETLNKCFLISLCRFLYRCRRTLLSWLGKSGAYRATQMSLYVCQGVGFFVSTAVSSRFGDQIYNTVRNPEGPYPCICLRQLSYSSVSVTEAWASRSSEYLLSLRCCHPKALTQATLQSLIFGSFFIPVSLL